MSGKYGEPWRVVGRGTIRSGEWHPSGRWARGHLIGRMDWRDNEANARRICLAVNACSGLSDESLEAGVVEMLARGARVILTTRDAEQFTAAMTLLRDADELISDEDSQ